MTLPSVGLNVDAEIDRGSVDKLTDAVIDLFSPATETAGLLGDVVRWARIGVATKITRRAKAIADENGLRLVSPPLRFLVPFYEKCSLEEDDNNLRERWAKLLVSAGSDYDPVLSSYVDILSRIGANEIGILEGMCSHWQVDTETFRAFEMMMEYRDVFASIVTNLTATPEPGAGLEKAIQENTGLAGRRVLRAFLMTSAGSGTVYHTKAYRGRERSFDILERERLIFVDEIEGLAPQTSQAIWGMMRPKIFVAQPTAIGFDLVKRCQ